MRQRTDVMGELSGRIGAVIALIMLLGISALILGAIFSPADAAVIAADAKLALTV